MRIIFCFNSDKRYELGNADVVEKAVSSFLDSHIITGYDREERFTNGVD